MEKVSEQTTFFVTCISSFLLLVSRHMALASTSEQHTTNNRSTIPLISAKLNVAPIKGIYSPWLTALYLLKTFIVNRITDIQSNTEIEAWRNASLGDNPADLISCGQITSDFSNSNFWLAGPCWLPETGES